MVRRLCDSGVTALRLPGQSFKWIDMSTSFFEDFYGHLYDVYLFDPLVSNNQKAPLACNPTCWRLQTLCGSGCHPMWLRRSPHLAEAAIPCGVGFNPYVVAAVTLFGGGCHPM